MARTVLRKTKRLITPPNVHSRTKAAVDRWLEYLPGAIVVVASLGSPMIEAELWQDRQPE